MNVTVNRTTIDDLKNVTIASSSVANHDAHLYAYLIIGPMLEALLGSRSCISEQWIDRNKCSIDGNTPMDCFCH
ncbi:hypothetical protein LOAG_12674 [Loa loa]|uniref:Uncharacterized protein n=1 Tax=Loa loa TaxID=7209 RepID=A0A1S0TM93_LOALO|nr:hypothetical protein LOAG_12674 [Loa loa]EFO15836.1 hypothetical protein LOAG_12674 [Loa loa]